MSKMLWISLGLLVSLVFTLSVCFATDNGSGLGTAANGVRNVVGGVENTVENAAIGVSNASKEATGSMENGADGNNRNMTASSTDMGNKTAGTYSTRRVAGENGTTLMGMTSTGWTWLIIGIAAIAIIAVVWYYSMQFTNGRHHDDNDRLE